MSKNKKHTCYTCPYKREVAGSVHSSCVFDFRNSNHSKPKGADTGVKRGWFNFPNNYDPIWMLTQCPAHPSVLIDTIDKELFEAEDSANVVLKTSDQLIIRWTLTGIGFGELKMIWSPISSTFILNTENIGIDSVLRIFKALENV